MKKLIRKILREEINKSDKHYRRLDIISDHVDLPYFKSMEGLTIYEHDDQLYIMKKIFGNDIYFYEELRRYIYNDNNDKRVYEEDDNGYWTKWEYDDNGNRIYYEQSSGHWKKTEWDDNGDMLYYETSDGYIIDNR